MDESDMEIGKQNSALGHACEQEGKETEPQCIRSQANERRDPRFQEWNIEDRMAFPDAHSTGTSSISKSKKETRLLIMPSYQKAGAAS
jgi:hypothetical protein